MIEERNDDWTNPATGLGGMRDKSAGLSFVAGPRLDRRTRVALWERSPIAARIIAKVVDDALSKGFELVGLDAANTERAQDEIARLKLIPALGRWARWGRLHGGALLTLPTREREPTSPDLPLDLDNAVELMAPQVITSEACEPLETDTAWASPTFGRTIVYQLTRNVKHTTNVHHSRVCVFESIELPLEDQIDSRYAWGPSELDRVFDDMKRAGASKTHALSTMWAASILFLKLHGYRNTYKTAEGKDQLQRMLADAAGDMRSTGLFGLDALDELGTINLSLADTHKMVSTFRDELASATIYPREVLFNESENGLRGGELSGAQELYHKTVGAFQTDKLEPGLLKALRVIYAALGIRAEPEVRWLPLWERSESETAETANKNAQTDQIYTLLGANTQDEVRRHRFEQGRMGPLELDTDEAEPPLDLSAEVAAYQQAEPEEPANEPPPPADTALAGAQIAGMLAIVQAVTAGEVPRDAAIGIIGTAFPAARGREHLILGSAEPAAPAPALAPTAGQPGPTPETDDTGPSVEPAPSDLMSPRDAAAAYGLPTRTITLQIERGALSYWGIGSHKRVSAAEVAALARAHMAEPETPEDAA